VGRRAAGSGEQPRKKREKKIGGPKAPEDPLGIRKVLIYFFFLVAFFAFLAAFFFVAIVSPPSRQLIDSLRARC
jgi:hypothetical protein